MVGTMSEQKLKPMKISRKDVKRIIKEEVIAELRGYGNLDKVKYTGLSKAPGIVTFSFVYAPGEEDIEIDADVVLDKGDNMDDILEKAGSIIFNELKENGIELSVTGEWSFGGILSQIFNSQEFYSDVELILKEI